MATLDEFSVETRGDHFIKISGITYGDMGHISVSLLIVFLMYQNDVGDLREVLELAKSLPDYDEDTIAEQLMEDYYSTQSYQTYYQRNERQDRPEILALVREYAPGFAG